MLVKELEQSGSNVVVINTSQHTDLLAPVLKFFKIEPTYNLGLMRSSQSSHYIASKVISSLEKIFSKEKPDLVIVQGDTTSACSGALAAFYSQIAVAHIEAGLRTHTPNSPFPEEMNRRIISQIATLNFAPTRRNSLNLSQEGINKKNIFVTGNSVIDALSFILNNEELRFGKNNLLHKLIQNKNEKIILLTVHRQENFGEPLKNIFEAINYIVSSNQDIRVVFPMHPNPNVKFAADKYLQQSKRINICTPLEYPDFISVMSKSFLVMTDSGGVQEESPALGKPVIILRNSTERAEVEKLGNGIVAGTSSKAIVEIANNLLTNKSAYTKMAKVSFPFGKGGATKKIAAQIIKFLDKNKL